MGVPSGEYLAAFESRLRKTCPIRSGSASTCSPALRSPRTITSTGWCPGRVLAFDRGDGSYVPDQGGQGVEFPLRCGRGIVAYLWILPLDREHLVELANRGYRRL